MSIYNIYFHVNHSNSLFWDLVAHHIRNAIVEYLVHQKLYDAFEIFGGNGVINGDPNKQEAFWGNCV